MNLVMAEEKLDGVDWRCEGLTQHIQYMHDVRGLSSFRVNTERFRDHLPPATCHLTSATCESVFVPALVTTARARYNGRCSCRLDGPTVASATAVGINEILALFWKPHADVDVCFEINPSCDEESESDRITSLTKDDPVVTTTEL